MADNIVIVESPAKAKTIEKILGDNFLVKSSFGHIRDLPKSGIGIDIENDFTPQYEVSPAKAKVVSELKKAVSAAKTVWLASDEDREGEAIAWHLNEVLNLKKKETKRIVFHEITKNAIENAIKTPRDINYDLVNAQQARRVIDRLVGFELSPVLWRKIKPSLSAGRVQSVTVRLIVEREREIINHVSKNFYKTVALFSVTSENGSSTSFKAELNKRFRAKEEALAFVEKCIGGVFTVASIDTKAGKSSPAAPFTTSTLQQEASRKLGFSVNRTMSVAQRLYEAGHISYMRTDSVNLSNEAMESISQAIESNYGSAYLQPRKFRTKSKGAQEAHEAIRPTSIARVEAGASSEESRLYQLIWKRAVASQMSDAILENTTIGITIDGSEYKFVAKGKVIKFDGYMKLYTVSSDDNQKEEEGILPKLTISQPLDMLSMESTERFEQRPARYSEASLVKQLEELGIGRPSTYAPTITTIISRGYVVKEDREGDVREYTNITLKGGAVSQSIQKEKYGSDKAKLFPTDTGIIVNDYLAENFPDILNYNFTANIEGSFDEIAEGSVVWSDMLKEFYQPFHQSVEKAKEDSGFASSTHRLLGIDPASGKNIYARMGRFGAMVQIGELSDDEGAEKPKYAGLKGGQLLETVTLEQALELFRLPRNIGEFELKSVTIGLGRFGPYIRHDSKFTSLAKEDDPYTIELDRAVELIIAKREKEIKSILRTFENDEKMIVKEGRWGPYLIYDAENYKLPKGTDIAATSYEEFMKIVETTESTSKSKKTKADSAKKPAAKKTTAKKPATKRATTTKKPATKKVATARAKSQEK